MTENHDYTVPEQGSTDWHVPLNNNFDALDRDIPLWTTEDDRDNYVPLEGSHLIATDSGVVYEGDGSSWNQIGRIGSAGPALYSQESAPSGATQDDVWFDQAEGTMKYYDGDDWVSSASGSEDDDESGEVTSDVYIPMDDMSVSEAYDTSEGNNVGNYDIVSGNSYTGADFLDCRIDSGSHQGGAAPYYFPNHDWGQPDEVYTRIFIRLEPDWEMADHSTKCKLYWAGANMDDGTGGHGGGVPTGDNGWSVRVFCRGSSDDGTITPASYIYHMDQGSQYGDMVDWSDELLIGHWHQLDTYVKLNSVSNGSANRDGIYRAWLDGSLQADHTNLRWRTSQNSGIDRVGPGVYWGGTEVSPQDNHVHFDEHRISVGTEGL